MRTPSALPPAFAARMLQIFGLRPPPRLALSVSGGVDSMALASLTADWARSRGIELHAFIVNHNLRRGSAREAASVREALHQQLGLDSSVLDLDLGANPARVEELARAGRRTVLEDACAQFGATSLLMGHHLNDQAELFVQRLLMGSSWFGLAGMAAKTLLRPLVRPHAPPPVTIVRPFLQFQKSELQDWCRGHGVPWWEDPTNEDINLTQRNLVRRMYARGAEPPALALPRLAELIAFLGAQRAKAEHMAQLAFSQLEAAQRLTYDRGTATLQLGADVRALPLAVRMELLFRIVAPISPYNEEKLLTRRHRLRTLATDLVDRGRQLQTALGVRVTGNAARWTFYRETARKMDQARTEVFEAGPTWSAWTLLDNRWWMRWRLPRAEPGPKYFSVHMLAKPEPVMQALAAYVPAEALRELRRVCVSHPFLMWSDAALPHSVDYSRFIGFPSLSVSRGLDVEVRPKEYEYVVQ